MMNRVAIIKAMPHLHPDLPADERDALVWAHEMLTDIRFRELYSNFKNYDFDVLGKYGIDENEAKKLMSFIEEMGG